MRRLKSDDAVASSTLIVGNIEINREEYKINKGGEVMALPKKEFELFYLLATKPGKVFTREEILDRVWGNEVCSWRRTHRRAHQKIKRKNWR